LRARNKYLRSRALLGSVDFATSWSIRLESWVNRIRREAAFLGGPGVLGVIHDALQELKNVGPLQFQEHAHKTLELLEYEAIKALAAQIDHRLFKLQIWARVKEDHPDLLDIPSP
jgi:hypothetical protein